MSSRAGCTYNTYVRDRVTDWATSDFYASRPFALLIIYFALFKGLKIDQYAQFYKIILRRSRSLLFSVVSATKQEYVKLRSVFGLF